MDQENQSQTDGQSIEPPATESTPPVTVTTEATIQTDVPATGETPPEEPVVYPSADVLEEPKNTVQTEVVYKSCLTNVPTPEGEVVISLLPTSIKTTIKITDENPAAEEGGTKEANDRIERMLPQAMMLHTTASQFVRSVERENAQWRQHIETQKGDLGISTPRFAESGQKLTGQAANIRMRALLGRGSLVSVPLVHSGFWITIRSPSDSALIALRSTLMNEKIALGRSTHGLVFSNVQSYSNSWLLDLALDHMYSTTLKDVKDEDIREMIKTPDLPLVFWGLACAIWPNGFNYVRPDLTQEGLEQKDYHSGVIDIQKTLWIDNSALTERQRSHMANRQPRSVTKDMIDIYMSEFPLKSGRSIELADGQIKVNMSMPSADKYIRSGYRWIGGLVDMIERTFTGNRADENARNSAIMEQANATIMRQYGHWIESIEFEGKAQTDADTLDMLIDTLAQDKEDRSKIFKAVSDFIDDVTVALIAIPEANGKEVGPKRFTRLIPIDAVTTFFSLLMQRTNQILSDE